MAHGRSSRSLSFAAAVLAYALAASAPAAAAPAEPLRQVLEGQPSRPVTVLHIHARDDSHVLFEGGTGPDARRGVVVIHFTSVPATVAKWAGLNGCAASPHRVLDQPGAACEAYLPCRGRAQVQLCVTETGGHSWPGAGKTRGGPASQALSANDRMWDFFSRR